MATGARGRRGYGAGARIAATPSAGRSRRGRRWARGGPGCAGAGSAARAGGRVGAPAQQQYISPFPSSCNLYIHPFLLKTLLL